MYRNSQRSKENNSFGSVILMLGLFVGLYKSLQSKPTIGDDNILRQRFLEQQATLKETLPIWLAKVQELNTQSNEYLRALTTGIWYYTTAILVAVGWIFTSLKGLTDLSNVFQFKELLSTYPNLCFPFLGVMLVNLVYVTVCCSLSHLFFTCRLRLAWIHKQFVNFGVVEPPNFRKANPFYIALLISVFFIPLLISGLILYRFPFWIDSITSPTLKLVISLYLALVSYYVLNVAALVYAALDLWGRYKELKRNT